MRHLSAGCLGNLKVGNATVENGTIWEVGTNITATCINDHLFVSANASTLEVVCTEDGWVQTDGCLKGEVVVGEEGW